MSRPSCSRRRLLHQGSTVTLIGLLVSIAGCSTLDFNLTDAADVPDYATWAPPPDRIYLETDNHPDRTTPPEWYPFRARRFDDLAAYLSRRNEPFEDMALYQEGKAHPVVDIEPSEAGTEIRFGRRGISVLETDRSDDDLIHAFKTPEPDEPVEEPFDPVGQYKSYQLLVGAEGDWVVGVNAGTIVEAFATGQRPLLRGKREIVEAVIDARTGAERYVDADPRLTELVTRLGTGMLVRIDPPRRENHSNAEPGDRGEPIASGVAYTSAETDNATQVLVFASTAAASEFAEAPTTETSRSWAEVSVTREGRYVSLRGTHHPATR